MIAKVNIWVDILATILVVIAVGFWIFQIIGNFVTGRFYRKFVGKEWPHHDKIVPLLPKVLHGTHVAAMIALAFTGLYIRYPFFAGGREIMRYIHYVAMYTVVFNFIFRLYYAFAKDSVEFKITLRDILNMPKVLMYYAFLRRSYPHLAKYNVMQKFTYGIAFPFLMVIQAYTGFSLLWPRTLLGWAAPIAGGVAAAAAWARIVHFVVCMLFIMLTAIHVCLSFIEDSPALLVFFGLAKQEIYVEHKRKRPKPRLRRRPRAAKAPLETEVEAEVEINGGETDE